MLSAMNSKARISEREREKAPNCADDDVIAGWLLMFVIDRKVPLKIH